MAYTMANNIFIDTETGGLQESRQSLISFAAIITDSRYTEINRVEYFIQPEEFVVTPKAMSINKIDLSLSLDWPTPDVVKSDFVAFLGLPASILAGVKNTRGRWLIHGKNPSYDVRFLKAFFGEDVYNSMFLYYEQDITDAYVDLARIGMCDYLEHMTLADLCAALGVVAEADKFHGAMFDTEMTMRCMQVMDKKYTWARTVLNKYKAAAKAKPAA